jgi:hypothetical protein
MDEKEWREEDNPITIMPVVIIPIPEDVHTWRKCPNPDCEYKHEGDSLDEF